MGLYIKAGGGGGAAISGAVTGATSGSALFAGPSGALTQDNANFFWDTANVELAIGTRNTGAAGFYGNESLYIGSDSNSPNQQKITIETAGVGAFILKAATYGGTLSSASVLSAGAGLFRILAQSLDTTLGSRDAAEIQFAMDVSATSAGTPGRVRILTDTIERVRITSVSNVAISTLAASTIVGIAGQLELQASALLWAGISGGILTHAWPAVLTTHTLTWPTNNAPGGLVNDGAGALSWGAPVTVSNNTSTRALDTTYTNAYSNKAVLVMATMTCRTTLLAGSATATPFASTSATPTVVAGGSIGVTSGIAGEANTFQLCFVVSAGSSMNYRINSLSANGTVTLGTWMEHTL